jgi:hypothetical protein
MALIKTKTYTKDFSKELKEKRRIKESSVFLFVFFLSFGLLAFLSAKSASSAGNQK